MGGGGSPGDRGGARRRGRSRRCGSSRGCKRWRWRLRRRSSRRVTLDEELSDLFPFQSDKNLDAVCTRQKFLSRGVPFCGTIAADFAVPWNGFIMDKFSIAQPQGGPLRAGSHLVIAEDTTYVSRWILENRRGFEIQKVRAIACKLKRAEHRVGIGSHIAFE